MNEVSVLVGLLMPVAIEVVKQKRFPNYVNAAIVVISCLVAGAVQVYLSGKLLEMTTVLRAGVLILIAAVAAYKAYWQNVLGDSLYNLTNI